MRLSCGGALMCVDESAQSVAPVDLDGWLRAGEARAPPWYRCCQHTCDAAVVLARSEDEIYQTALKEGLMGRRAYFPSRHE